MSLFFAPRPELLYYQIDPNRSQAAGRRVAQLKDHIMTDAEIAAEPANIQEVSKFNLREERWMSLFEKMETATRNRDADGYIALMADDCVFVRHQTGTQMNRAEIAEMLKRMMSSDGANLGSRRCIYENDDILVVHSVNDYPDGTKEAVLAAYMLKDGKITRLETGATPLAS